MYVYTTAPPQPRRVLGGDAISEVQSATPMTNAVRIALILAAGAGAYALYRKATGKPLTPNLLPPWPGIGPIFSYSSGIGPAYSLTPFIV